MKSLINFQKNKALLLSLTILYLLHFSCCIRIEKIWRIDPESKDGQLESAWKRLFTDPNRSTLSCDNKNELKKTNEEKKMEQEDRVKYGAKPGMPKKKENYYERKMIGWGPSAYLFDFIDDVLEKEIVSEFKRIWLEANTITPDPTFKDPYSLENMLGMTGTEEELLQKVLSLTLKSDGTYTFDKKSWQNSLPLAKLAKLVDEWKWYVDKKKPDPYKAILDKFDFNGDGRLNPKEFIIAMIRNNKLISEIGVCKNCLEKIVNESINPIFMYLDCSNAEKINSQDIWNNLQKLKRSNANTFNFYLCEVNGGTFRTSTVNDFIIKSKVTLEGYLSKSEFRQAILNGYWTRHVDEYTIYDDDKRNMKSLRWSEDGTVDKVCEAIKNNS